MPCLSESQVLGFVELRLSSKEQSTLEAHIDACAACRRLLADVARSAPTPRGDTPNLAAPTTFNAGASAGAVILDAPQVPDEPASRGPDRSSRTLKFGSPLADRYVILEILGMGGMGVVYAAYDRQLDRKVALKLVRPECGNEERLFREAKSLARLSHPNVVVVHDVGEALGRTYMAMELIEGRTLRRWIEEEHPSVEGVLAAFLEAAKGLSAAHASGLVHRDFKPDNVLIANDGRVRVTDFGLARPLAPKGEGWRPSSPDGVEIAAPPVDLADQSGSTLEGTPVYMAPERFAGRPSEARGDQFAFCVSLYESLYGEIPFAGESLRDLVKAMRDGRIRPPRRGSKVPASVRGALLRGLSPDPQNRFPSMEALTAALTANKRRRRALRLSVVALVAAVGAGSAITALHAREAPPLCQGSDRRLAGLWDEPRRKEVEQAFLKTGLPYAEASFRSVREALDRYTAKWSAERTEACVATRVYGEQSEEVLDLRVACLEGHLLKLRAVVDTMVTADGATVQKAADAVSKLADPDLCGAAGVQSERVLPPEGSEVRAKVSALRERLAKVEALRSLGHRREVIDGAMAIYREAQELGYRPLEAEVGLVLGSVLRERVGSAETRKTLEKSIIAAEAGHHERAALGLWLELANNAIWDEARYEDAERALSHAGAYLDRLGGDSERVMLLERRSALCRAQDRIPEATRAARDAVSLAERTFGAGSIRVAGVLMELGIMLHLSGEEDASIQAFSRAIAITERELGRQHPSIGILLTNFGVVYINQKRFPEAAEALRRAADILEQAFGPGPGLSSALGALSEALTGMGRSQEALEAAQRALAMQEVALNANHPDVAGTLTRVAEAFAGLSRWDDAGAAFLRACEIAAASEAPQLAAATLASAKKALGPCGERCKGVLRRIEERAAERRR